MISVPSVLFLNCIGSYYYSIIQHLSGGEQDNSLLFFLHFGRPVYEKLDLEKIRLKYHDNPWGYQPVVLKEQNDGMITVNQKFYGFLKEKFNLTVDSVIMNENIDIIEGLRRNTEEGKFSIVNVDEYFIPSSTKSYRKRHNKHFLLLKSIDYEKKELQMIDSELNHDILVSAEALEQSVYQSTFNHNLFYSVDGSGFVNRVETAEFLKQVVSEVLTCDFIPQMMADMQEKLERKESKYYYHGYYYNILSKIIPYSHMVYAILKDNNIALYEEERELLKEWKMLCSFMSFKLLKNSCLYEPVQKKLLHIQNHSGEIKSCLQGLSF